MSSWYLDTSAALKLVQVESQSAALIDLINEERPTLVGCWLLETELRRAVHRNPALSNDRVSGLLATVEVHEMPPSIFREAGFFPGKHLRSLDALHLAAAIRTGADRLVTYDVRMADFAHQLGLHVIAPA